MKKVNLNSSNSSCNQQAKKLGVQVKISAIAPTVTVILDDGVKILYQKDFDMLPNVPLESYIQFAFGMYNASISENPTEKTA